MLTIQFDAHGKLSLYEALYRQIRDEIRSGVLKAGDRLPSKRAMAEHNGISIMTVENAYGQLLSEGYILSEPRKGFFVAQLPKVTAEVLPVSRPAPEAEPVKHSWLADFSSNQTSDFPFNSWSTTVRRVLSEDRSRLLTNAPWGGIPELRRAIADHLATFRGMDVRPQQVLVGAGTEYLYGLLIQLLGLEKTYAVEDPGYSKLRRIYQSHGAHCEAVQMDSAGVRIDALLEKQVDVAHLSPAHHFPTGLVMPITRRHELLQWAADGRYIIEDDYDSEFRMAGLPIPTLQSIDRSGRVIYMNTFSKTLASTVRISYMVLPEPLLDRFRRELSFYSCTVSNLEQYTLANFIARGSFERHLNRMRTDYHRRRDELLRLLRDHPQAHRITISEEDAGLHFLIHAQTALSDAEAVERAAALSIRLTPLSQYYADESKKTLHSFVINYSSVPMEVMPEAVQRLYQVFMPD